LAPGLASRPSFRLPNYQARGKGEVVLAAIAVGIKVNNRIVGLLARGLVNRSAYLITTPTLNV